VTTAAAVTGSSLPGDLAILRDALIDARHGRTTVAAHDLPVPRNDDEAYAVQQAVADALGWFEAAPAHAWKVGAARRDALPNAAPLPAQRVARSPATFDVGAFNRMLIEGEIAFRLRAPIDDADERAMSAAIGEWLVTIEIVDPRYADMNAATPTQKLADQGLHGALVIGSGAPFPAIVDWSSLVARLRRDGEVVRETRGGHPLGNLLFLLPWLARHAAARGMPLRAGDIVTAGTWTGVFEAFPGETIDVEFDGVGAASVRFG
jgi:2-keto-4-pentenoate hydratase